MGLLKEQCAEWRYICCIVGITSGWKLVGRFHGMLLLSAKHSRSLLRRFGKPFNGPVTLFGAMVEYHPISVEDLSRLHQFGPKVLPGIFLGYVLSAVWIWKGDIMIADTEELDEMDASEPHAGRLSPSGPTLLQFKKSRLVAYFQATAQKDM